MSKEPERPTSEPEDPVDRFEHEIEALEEPMGHSLRQWLFGLVAALVIVGGFFVGSYFLNKKAPTSAANVPDLPTIDMMEPRRGKLPAVPYMFRWEAIANTNTYVVRVVNEATSAELFTRELKAPQMQLTPEERATFGEGGRFKWTVEARARFGKPLAMGKSAFNF
jgi:hypothetical protein